MLQSSSEFNNLGGQGAGGWGGFGGFGGGGNFGAFGLIGLLGLDDIIGKRKRGEDDGPVRNELATLAAISNLKDITVSENRALDAAICEVKGNIKDALYAQTIQGMNQTADLKAQAQAFQIANDGKFEALSAEGTRNTAAIIARINQTEVDQLRDALAGERRRVDSRELEINITNSNTSLQQQIQAQAQAQLQAQWQAKSDADRKFDLLFSQVAKASQDIINVGGYMKDSSQTANPTNIK